MFLDIICFIKFSKRNIKWSLYEIYIGLFNTYSTLSAVKVLYFSDLLRDGK